MRETFEIHYGREILPIELDVGRVVYNLRPTDIETVGDVRTETLRALSEPIGSKRLCKIVGTGKKVVILGDDGTRFTPTKEIVPVVLDELNRGGVADEDITLVIATGSHRAMTDGQIEEKYGQAVTGRIKVINHNYLDGDNLVSCGVTSRGTDVWVSKLVLEADVRIGIGNIAPHHPTGWSGGAKILLPGVAGEHTTGQMHLLGAIEQQLGKVETPCRAEMEDFARNTGLDFIVNTVLDREGGVVRIVGGDFIEAHREGVKWGQTVFGVGFTEKSNITISSTYPVDFDLFQADKGLFSAAITTKEGGEIILVSPCYEGVSPTHPESVDLACLSDEELFELTKKQDCEYDILSIAEVLYFNTAKRDFKVTIVSGGISKETAEKLNFNYVEPAALQDYITSQMTGDSGTKTGIIHNSAETLPIYKKE